MSRTSILLLGANALCLWCCGGSPREGVAEEALRDIQPICDGSDDVRLLFAARAGLGSVYDGFTAFNGERYLAVDGHCDYFVRENSLRGLRRGTLDSDRASVLSSELQFGRYSSAPSYSPEGCVDAATWVLQDDSGRLVSSGCGRTAGAPAVWSKAFDGISRLFPSLVAESRPAWDATRLVAIRAPAPSGAQVSSWTGQLDFEAYTIDFEELMFEVDGSTGVLVEDEPTLELLSGLRLSALAGGASAAILHVEDAAGRGYQLLLRDEPPSFIAEALRAALVPSE